MKYRLLAATVYVFTLLCLAGLRAPSAGATQPDGADEARLMAEIERQVSEIKEQRGITFHWQYSPEIIPVHIRDRLRASQASVEQVQMMLRLTHRLLEIWPQEVTKHINAIYAFHEIEMYGIVGVCMEYDGGVFMTCNLPEYVLWPRIIHEAAHAVSRYVRLDAELWNRHLAPDARYIGAEATQGNPFEINEEILSRGFLEKYAQIDLDEEFAILSQYIFGAPDRIIELMNKYPAVRTRATLAINYYRALSDELDLSHFDDVIRKDL